MNFQIIGLAALGRYTKTRQKRLKNQRGVHGKAVVAVDAWIQKNFQQEGKLAYPGTGWQKLSPATIEMRRKGKKSKHGVKILQDTGMLKSNWKKQWSIKSGVIAAAMPYAEKHNEGIGVPERKILPTESQIMPTLIKIYGKFVRTSLSHD